MTASSPFVEGRSEREVCNDTTGELVDDYRSAFQILMQPASLAR